MLGPVEIGLVARELTQEVGARHAGITHAQLHDGAFLSADLVQGITHALDQGIVLFGHELDRHKQDGEGFKLLGGLLAGAAVLLQGLVGFLKLFGDRAEAHARNFRIGPAVAFFFLGIRLFFFVVVLVVDYRLGRGLWRFRLDFLRRGSTVVVGVDIAAEDVGQATAFVRHALVVSEDAVDGAREVGDRAHDFANAFLDAFGDFDLAFAGQQFDGAHFAHVHTHWVGGAADIGLDRGECGCGLFGCGFIGIGFGQQQGIGIRSGLEYVDAHVVDHANDVFHLFRIGNILRQVVVNLGVSQVTLLTATLDQLFEAGLLLRFSGHITLSTEGSGGLKTS